jgi:hypothetical protein
MKTEKLLETESLLKILLLCLFVAMVFSGRPLLPTSTPRIRQIAVLPATEKLEPLRRYTEMGSGLLPYNAREQLDRTPPSWDAPRPLKVGYSYREVSFLRLPFAAYTEYGIVTFVDTVGGYKICLLTPGQVEALNEAAGRDFSGIGLQPWRHVWGWLFVLGIAGLGFLHMRRLAGWREAHGII